MYVVTVEFKIKHENIKEFTQAMHLQAKNSLEFEPACRHFDVCISEKNSDHIFLYELYDDRTAFDVHLNSSHFKEFDALVKDWINEKLVATWLL